jgi:hypothetical protein
VRIWGLADMTARILVVDAAESNAKLLEALLLREYY